MKKSIVYLTTALMVLSFMSAAYSMQWDITDHPENQSTISWEENHKWLTLGKISAMYIVNGNTVDELHAFKEEDDEGESAISRQWHLRITDLPDSALWPERSVQVTFYGQDYPLDSVLDGSTFGEISVWEHNPLNSNEINLVIDFTKVRSQGHEFGVHVLIVHGVCGAPMMATPLSD